jgi:hypothetical protein
MVLEASSIPRHDIKFQKKACVSISALAVEFSAESTSRWPQEKQAGVVPTCSLGDHPGFEPALSELVIARHSCFHCASIRA